MADVCVFVEAGIISASSDATMTPRGNLRTPHTASRTIPFPVAILRGEAQRAGVRSPKLSIAAVAVWLFVDCFGFAGQGQAIAVAAAALQPR